MKRSRAALLIVSSALVLLLVGGGLALRVGAADNPYRHVLRFSEVLSLVMENYVDPVDPNVLLEGAYEGMLGGIDATGTYLTPKEVAEWSEKNSEEAADPGVSVLKAFGALQIVSVAPGSPAETSGLVPGDQIRRVDGRLLRDLSLEQALRLLRGKPGSSVVLSVLHPRDAFRREELALQRVHRSENPHRLEIDRGIAVLTLRDLPRVSAETVAAQLRDAQTKGVSKLLVDLRDLVEGTPRQAGALMGLFASGEILRLRDRQGHVKETLTTPDRKTVWSGSIGLLVNGTTAGGSEAIARVLQVRRGATVYGEATYGHAAEPKLFKLPDGAGFLLPAYLWETPTGQSWEGNGVEPDTVVTAEGREKEAAADQLRRTLEAFARTTPSAAPERKAA